MAASKQHPHHDAMLKDLQAGARDWQSRFNTPLGLGVKKKASNDAKIG